ncbi:MAG TPA: iron-sulfur binding hydrogenase [Thermotogota bacterium]|jgi:hypothetical protein|nr:iron-sulfur binding hydrogenase [Thermotogota bacterium]NLZ12878.1 iron-sulfur binding hydrogenase [Thermotogaceae bacterium]MDD8040405.1 iron-sulfur binding hydrogenase [Thermotogota bacterium]MDD8053698.1 iron-sulfur binding hydrogenase [Thermotogota bacterium]HNR63626.1 iron-sulfur binding hydrogenase [Thermotogota bacterium]
MRFSQALERISGTVVTGDPESLEVSQGITCDLLSEVMSHNGKADLWITVQSHSNIVAVALIVGVKAIILANGRDYNADTVQKARDENVLLVKSPLGGFELSGIFYEMLQG